jgi:hypothetical protein
MMTVLASSIIPSFCPGEVISAGSLLEFRLSRPVDTTTHPGTIRVLRGPSIIHLSATVSGDGKVMQVGTDGRQEGSGSLIVDDLLDTDGQRFEAPNSNSIQHSCHPRTNPR